LSKTNPKAKRNKRNKKQRRKGLVFDVNLGNRFCFSKISDYQLPTYARTRTTKQTPAPPSFSSSSPPPSQVHVYATSALPALSLGRESTVEANEEEVSVVTGSSEEGGGGAGGAGGNREVKTPKSAKQSRHELKELRNQQDPKTCTASKSEETPDRWIERDKTEEADQCKKSESSRREMRWSEEESEVRNDVLIRKRE
jgi:hypothetical protein